MSIVYNILDQSLSKFLFSLEINALRVCIYILVYIHVWFERNPYFGNTTLNHKIVFP